MSRPGDRSERDADRAAAAAMGSSRFEAQRSARAETSEFAVAPPEVHRGLRSSSQPLDPDARRFMESRFGHDFGGVRVHAGSEAAEASRAAEAAAYTVGSDIVFGAGQYRPGTLGGRELIAHELAHVVEQRSGEPMVSRRMLYPDARVTDGNDDPIARYLRNDNSLALTTLTINGSEVSDRVLQDALNPKEIEAKDAPAAPGGGSGSGSGAGSGSAAPVPHCGYKNFDVSVSAKIRMPKPPSDGRWGPEEVERRRITRPGLPAKCGQQDRISVVMKGEPNSADFRAWMEVNEREHATDMKAAAEQLLAPYHQSVLALRGTGADANACSADLNSKLNRLSIDNVGRFLQKVRDDIAGRDVPGGHKFDATFQDRNDCANLAITLKKTPAPPRRP